MGLSYVNYTGNGVLATYSYANIDLLDDDLVTYASQLRVYVDNNLQVLNTAYTVSVINQTITFQAGYIPAPNAIIKISRFTKSDDRYINYTNSTNITASILNTDAKQLFFLTQEAIDLRDDAMVLNNNDKWEGRGKTITNIGPASDATDAVNLAQLNAAITGTLPSTLGTKGNTNFTGNGSTTDYTLPGEALGLAAKDFEVYVNGVKQTPVTAYTVSGSTITFSPALANGVVADVYYNKGTVPAAFGADAVTTTMIQNRAVTEQKIDATGATTNHVLRVTNSPSGEVDWGTIPSTTISDFDTQVRTSRLDQMATPTADVNLGSRKITNLAQPVNSGDAVNKFYLNTIHWKAVHLQQTQINARWTTDGRNQASSPATANDIQTRYFSVPSFSYFKGFSLSIPIHTGKSGANSSNLAVIQWLDLAVDFPAGIGDSSGLGGHGPTRLMYGYNLSNVINTGVYGIYYTNWYINGTTLEVQVYRATNVGGGYTGLYYNPNLTNYPLPTGVTNPSLPVTHFFGHPQDSILGWQCTVYGY